MRLFDREGEVINGGRPFPAKYDRRHDFSLTISHRLTDNIDLSASWVYNTGNCATLALQTYESLPNEFYFSGVYPNFSGDVNYVPSRNNYRYDPYHRLDVSISFHKQKRYGRRTWNISIYNAYNSMNPFMMYASSDYEEQGVGNYVEVKKFKKVTLFPIIPSLTYSYKF
jgi:hypothetical protein